MSNFKAVAAVTQTLKRRLEQVILEPVPEAVITTTRPEAEPQGIDKKLPRINLYLFQTVNNPSFRNTDLPTRNGDGGLVQRPQVALDLSYLLSFFGDDHLKGQILLGLATSTLHTDPYLSAPEIRSATQGTPFHDSGLPDQEVGVRVAPMTLTLEELTKFWSGFFQVPYTLSLAYQASVVLLDADRVPQAALPVQGAALRGGPARLPQLFGVQPAVLEALPGAEVTLTGSNLGGSTGVVGFGDRIVQVSGASEQSQITVPLPPGLRAGTVSVRAGSLVQPGPSAEPRPVLTSNTLSLVVQPRIEGAVRFDPASRTIELAVHPGIARGQVIQLLLNEIEKGQPSYSYSRVSEEDQPSHVSFHAPDVAPGTYLVQIVVAGAASRLGTRLGRYSEPSVRVPPLP